MNTETAVTLIIRENYPPGCPICGARARLYEDARGPFDIALCDESPDHNPLIPPYRPRE